MPPGFCVKRQGLLLVAVVCVVFLFFGGPDLMPSRSFKLAWDLGHIAAFAVWTLLLMRTWPWLASAPFGREVMVVMLFCLVAGGSVEVLQGLTGRYPAWADMGRNAIGCLLALFFLFPKRLSLARCWRRLLQAVILALLLMTLFPVTRALVDEWRAWRQFPVLADFETPFELERWSGHAGLSVDETIAHSGRASLRVDLNTDLYSGPALRYFPGNWQGWKRISFNIYNPDTEPIRLVCKINDRRHDVSGYRYEDRFNRSILIKSGWNRIPVSMRDVENAPIDRKMDLTHLTEFNLFAVSLPVPRTIFLDSLMLEP
jgi:hypothetical protein